MKKVALVLIICLSLMMTSLKTQAVMNEAPSYQPSIVSLSPNRIYGEDLSETIFSRVSMSSYREYVRKLTENGSRWISHPGLRSDANIAAGNWIADELMRVSDGRMEVEFIGEYDSVVGRLPGYFPYDAPVLLVGGHFDSVSNSPGANDDGSGVAAMLELARVMSDYEWPLDIYFGAWNAEEIGLYGAQEVAQEFQNRGIEILVHYNNDMLLVRDPQAPTSRSLLLGYPDMVYQEGQYWAEQAMLMSETYGDGMIMPVKSSDFSGWQRSDHWAFITKGHSKSLFGTESGFGNDVAYHTSHDTWDNPMYDYTTGVEMVKAIGATMAFTMSREYQKLNRVEQTFHLSPGTERNYYFTVSTPTTVTVSCRWWAGGAEFQLYDSVGGLIDMSEFNESSAWQSSIVLSPSVEDFGIYNLRILNPYDTTAGYEFAFEYESDVDGNAVPDSQEFWFDTVHFQTDSDSDFLSDAEEFIIGTSSEHADSDLDEMIDSWELEFGLDPLNASDAQRDDDSDGLTNLDEFLNNCNPHLSDSDHDLIPDLWEIENDLDPSVDDASGDPDNDAVDNLREYLEGTDPHYAEFRIERYMPIITISAVTFVAVGVFIALRVSRGSMLKM
ncbi:MAG: M28 family peptidase [Candidatus Thorarchaeota archaeon]|jgi:hypothetical protein